MFSRFIFKGLSTEPVSRQFGFDRGQPIDRYYIDFFLRKNSQYIKGDVLEISESLYTKKFGTNVNKSMILSFVYGDNVDYVCDLSSDTEIPENVCDCFIMTQTLPFIYDVDCVVKNSIRILKPGGILLVTIPGITQISRYDMDRWGHFWSFTDLSVRKLFEKNVEPGKIYIETYGNVKTASGLLYGLASRDFSKRDLDYKDDDYQVTIGVRVTK